MLGISPIYSLPPRRNGSLIAGKGSTSSDRGALEDSHTLNKPPLSVNSKPTNTDAKTKHTVWRGRSQYGFSRGSFPFQIGSRT